MRRVAVPVSGSTGGPGRARGSRWRAGRLLRAGGRLQAGAVLAGLVVVLGAAAPVSAQVLTWSVVPSPNPGPRSAGNALVGVSCVSATACTAVGGHNTRTLIESWNGARWSVVPSPGPGPGGGFLESVSCVSATACMAVGVHLDMSLAESWNGARWSVVPSPRPGSDSELHGVSCTVAGTCMAVGFYATSTGVVRTLIESWNGTRWAVVPSRNPGTARSIRDLRSVSCTSAAACTATGNYFARRHGPGRTLVESWNGTRWAVVPSPSRGSDSYLQGVSCTSAAACMATGYSTISGPDGPERTLAESWNGTRWSVVPTPNRGNASYLLSLSCPSATVCTATGYSFINDPNLRKTLVESGTASG